MISYAVIVGRQGLGGVKQAACEKFGPVLASRLENSINKEKKDGFWKRLGDFRRRDVGDDRIVAAYSGGDATKNARTGVLTYRPKNFNGCEALVWRPELAGIDGYTSAELPASTPGTT